MTAIHLFGLIAGYGTAVVLGIAAVIAIAGFALEIISDILC